MRTASAIWLLVIAACGCRDESSRDGWGITGGPPLPDHESAPTSPHAPPTRLSWGDYVGDCGYLGGVLQLGGDTSHAYRDALVVLGQACEVHDERLRRAARDAGQIRNHDDRVRVLFRSDHGGQLLDGLQQQFLQYALDSA